MSSKQLRESEARAPLEENPQATTDKDEGSHTLEIIYSTGWRIWCTVVGVAMATAATNIEVSIIGTSLVKIAEDLHGFERQGWVVTAYLITYTSFIVIWSKMSAVLGRKSAGIASALIFMACSGGCGAAQTIDQLIITRAFQGVGAAGCMSCGIATIYDLVPKRRIPTYNALITAFSALGGLVGPIIGGAFSRAGQWRWSFLINVPIGVIIVLLFAIATPSYIPYHNNPRYRRPTWKEQLSRHNLGRLDLSGTVFLLSGSIILVAVILEGGSSWSWDSGTSIALFVVSGVLFTLFMMNEYIVSSDKCRQEPLFPMRFLFNRAWLGVLLTSVLSSIPYNTVTINLSQRFQIVEGDSPLRAGERLIPFNFFISIGAIVVNVIAMALKKIPPIFLLFTGGILESIGEILAGTGIGFIWGLVLTLPPSIVEDRDKDIAGGAIFQTRVFGGALGLSIASSVLNNYLTNHLGGVVGSVAALFADPTAIFSKLSQDQENRVLTTFAEGYTLESKIMVAFAAAQLLSIALLWKKPQISLEGPGGKNEGKEGDQEQVSDTVTIETSHDEAIREK